MFRFYRSIGGDSADIAMKRFAARMTCRIMLAAIQTLTPATSPSDAAHFASALMKADLADWPAEGMSGGAYHKVIRWAFEKQGLYQRASTARPNNKTGAPPPVDVYIEDGRHGEYQFQSNYWSCQAIWNRRRSDGGTAIKSRSPGVTNYAYVKIKNRGFKTATKVVVRGFSRRVGGGAGLSRRLAADEDGAACGRERAAQFVRRNLVGPFAWVPSQAGRDYMLMVASAAGDPSNIDNFIRRRFDPGLAAGSERQQYRPAQCLSGGRRQAAGPRIPSSEFSGEEPVQQAGPHDRQSRAAPSAAQARLASDILERGRPRVCA